MDKYSKEFKLDNHLSRSMKTEALVGGFETVRPPLIEDLVKMLEEHGTVATVNSIHHDVTVDELMKHT